MTVVSYVKSKPARGQMRETDSTTYSLSLTNDSQNDWFFYVYQQLPQQSDDVFSLAWFCSPYLIANGTDITFQWEIDYQFVWGQTGTIMPGVTFSAGQTLKADLNSANQTTFTTNPAPSFSPTTAGNPPGSLMIQNASNVPDNTFGVGIGMSGVGTFIVGASPNILDTFTPTPQYWIAAGSDMTVGTVLNVSETNCPLEVKFPPNVYEVGYTLNSENVWVPNT